MSMTDPIADLLTRIRNAYAVGKENVDIPLSKTKKEIAATLKREGFITDYETIPTPPQGVLRVILKYGPDGERIINHIQRTSKPGCRMYTSLREMKPVLGGMGITIISTSKGIMSDREAKKERLGGEVLCTVW
jgi:small subunit ribosomal protein S8